MAHAVQTPFQIFHETVTRLAPTIYAISLHGQSSERCEDVFLSNGHRTDAKPILANLKSLLLDEGGMTVAMINDGSQCPFVGSTNVQGRFTNGSETPCTTPASSVTGRFIHIEQHRIVRDHLSETLKLVRALNQAVDLVTAIDIQETDKGNTSILFPAYPNPFNPMTTIQFEISEPSAVSLRIFDNRGRVVRHLVSDRLSAGLHRIVWDGRTNNGKRAASGLYFYALRVGKRFQGWGKMILMR